MYFQLALPSFNDLIQHYPGYHTHGGAYSKHHLFEEIGCGREFSNHDDVSNTLHHDTSALRLSFTFNKIGGQHSLGTKLVQLSTHGQDSVKGKDNLQYIYHPIAYGPYLADKYGYPNVSKLHSQDPLGVEHKFWGKQGIVRVITYRHVRTNIPHGHIALWDCDHFHQAKDWIIGSDLITVEFWQSPGEFDY